MEKQYHTTHILLQREIRDLSKTWLQQYQDFKRKKINNLHSLTPAHTAMLSQRLIELHTSIQFIEGVILAKSAHLNTLEKEGEKYEPTTNCYYSAIQKAKKAIAELSYTLAMYEKNQNNKIINGEVAYLETTLSDNTPWYWAFDLEKNYSSKLYVSLN